MSNLELDVRYFKQTDSEIPGQPGRSCFSSSCAMMLEHLIPGSLPGPNGDDTYLAKLMKNGGDSTLSVSQIKTLKEFGVTAQFRVDLNWADVEAQIKKGIPVPIGILIRGPVSSPEGGGHYIVVIGFTADGKGVIVHDPYGELDLLNGGYPYARTGKHVIYSRENLGKRWMVDGPSTGWGVIATEWVKNGKTYTTNTKEPVQEQKKKSVWTKVFRSPSNMEAYQNNQPKLKGRAVIEWDTVNGQEFLSVELDGKKVSKLRRVNLEIEEEA